MLENRRLSQGQDVKAEFPPVTIDPIRPRTMRRLVAMACTLALVLLGLTVPGHSHSAEPAGHQAVLTAGHDGDHCPGSTHPSGPGHCCAGVHGHACCVLLEAKDLHGSYEEVWARLREIHGPGQMPRTVNMISGPSRTADIEQTIVRGAHGPKRLQVLILG